MVKKRNVLPLVKEKYKVLRITKVSKSAKKIYEELMEYKDLLYGYVKEIEEV